ncbi:gamma-glutamyl-gamma-aminobutyrate hydrolase family protein [Bifidobacterium avesanii]|uniref:Gamma-glutamyl-gamma-aminobutyrate hydrolase family protein n=1 Tax=Bifidobacterium avesanii TaxID=1798157 RepID=A0A7K3TH37_9BIFI|nr:gamma-glutamyl-gamma-aminobutyrate hydrolase family protein [Bifidobacterium avesanii]KAB8291437.1 amidotransferase [Bifidobacterium avesanii]NEG77930.1 gamma-glutamyl-gamma-aminobutyrate hydrolase family protein [Bifidobacterium avesanii]
MNERVTDVRPVIGITPLMDIERDSYWMLPGYMTGIEEAGGLPVMLPLTSDPALLSQAAVMCDGLLFSGGHDVDPSMYGEEPIAQCGRTCPERDAMERALLDIAVNRDMPVLGVCRGLQLMNAALGGTLYQDLPTQRPKPVNHDMQPPYDEPQHRVDIVEGTPLHELLGVRSLGVNSRHHQAVRRLAQSLNVMAVSEDGLVEAAWMPGKRFVWGVQWHPEHAWRTDVASRMLLETFVKEAGAR